MSFDAETYAVAKKYCDERFGSTKTTMDSVAIAGTKYFLGSQSAVSVVLPSTASAGQEILVVFYSGSTAATLSITGTTIGEVVTPAANQRIEINMMWDGTYWAIVSSVMDIPQGS